MKAYIAQSKTAASFPFPWAHQSPCNPSIVKCTTAWSIGKANDPGSLRTRLVTGEVTRHDQAVVWVWVFVPQLYDRVSVNHYILCSSVHVIITKVFSQFKMSHSKRSSSLCKKHHHHHPYARTRTQASRIERRVKRCGPHRVRTSFGRVIFRSQFTKVHVKFTPLRLMKVSLSPSGRQVHMIVLRCSQFFCVGFRCKLHPVGQLCKFMIVSVLCILISPWQPSVASFMSLSVSRRL